MTFDLAVVTLTMERLCQFSTFINASLLKMYMVTHYHIMLCNIASLIILYLWPWCYDLDKTFVHVNSQLVLMPAFCK